MTSVSAALHRASPRLYATARGLVRLVNTPLAKGRTRRALAAAQRPLRLEIGGLRPRRGWIVTNVNAVARHYLDAGRRWPLEDGALSHLYADNVIEHIDLAANRAMFAEAYRCLRPGGVIRLVTPDVRAHVEMYLSGAAALDSAAAVHYRELGLVVEHPVDLIRIPIGAFGHHLGYLWDFETLKAELERAGFTAVVRGAVGESEHPEFAALDVRTSEGGAQLAVEATR